MIVDINKPVKWDIAYGEVVMDSNLRFRAVLHRRNMKGEWVSLGGGVYSSRAMASKQLEFALDIMGK
jgi:hypothetical protein